MLLARLTELESKVADAVKASRADATIAAYRSDWAHFSDWCLGLGLAPLPAEPTTVAAYLADLANPSGESPGYAASTLARRKTAIGEAHKIAGHGNPCTAELVKLASKGIRRQLGVASTRRKKGLSTADLRAMVAEMDLGRPIEIRDRALLLVGFATALRRASLVGLNVEDVEDHPEGLLVNVRRSKTDQEGIGHRIEVAYGANPETCPVRAYRAWVDAAQISEGPLFRAVDRHGSVGRGRLSDRTVARVVQRHAKRLDRDPAEFGGHSLRRGFATEASRSQASERVIARTTGHTSTKGLTPYIADAELFTDPPSRYLGL